MLLQLVDCRRAPVGYKLVERELADKVLRLGPVEECKLAARQQLVVELVGKDQQYSQLAGKQFVVDCKSIVVADRLVAEPVAGLVVELAVAELECYYSLVQSLHLKENLGLTKFYNSLFRRRQGC